MLNNEQRFFCGSRAVGRESVWVPGGVCPFLCRMCWPLGHIPDIAWLMETLMKGLNFPEDEAAAGAVERMSSSCLGLCNPERMSSEQVRAGRALNPSGVSPPHKNSHIPGVFSPWESFGISIRCRKAVNVF